MNEIYLVISLPEGIEIWGAFKNKASAQALVKREIGTWILTVPFYKDISEYRHIISGIHYDK